MPANIEVDNARVIAALNELINRVDNPRPALLDIAEHLIESTKSRFETTKAPDGTPWARNKPSTLDHKDGSTPLTDQGNLGRQFGKTVTNDTIEIFNTLEYAAMQQFGGTKAEFPWLWGDIPSRPFLGLSEEDETYIVNAVREFIEQAI